MVLGRLRSALDRLRPEKQAALRRPRLLGLSMVKNEQDIIEPFLRHNAKLLDALVVLDNASLDRTRDIALACARELGTVVVGDSPAFSFLQSERMSALLEASQAAFRADYVLFLDADEFLSAPGRDGLEAALGAIPAGGTGAIPWRTFVVRPGQEESVAADPPRHFTHRRATEAPPFYKAALRLDGRAATGLTVAQGNHAVLAAGQALPSVPIEELQLLHFPVRSSRQIVTKAVVGWTACVARSPTAREENLCFQWRDAFDRLAAGGQAAVEAELAGISFGYAQQRPPADWATDAVAEAPPSLEKRTYSDGAFADPLGLVARSWERSLSRGDGAGGSAPLRFIAEKYQPQRTLYIGGAVDALAGLGTVARCGEELGGAGAEPFDLVVWLAMAAGKARAPIERLLGNRAVVSLASGAAGPELRRWLQAWMASGWAPDLFDSMAARALADTPAGRTTVVLTRGGDGAAAADALCAALPPAYRPAPVSVDAGGGGAA